MFTRLLRLKHSLDLPEGCQVSGMKSDMNQFLGAFGHKHTPKWHVKTNRTVVGCFSLAIHDLKDLCKVYHYKAVLKKRPVKAHRNKRTF